MFRIRCIYDDVLPVNRDAVGQVQDIMRTQFTALSEETVAKLPDQVHDSLKYRFRSRLYVAEDAFGKVHGFAHALHASDLNFLYLDFISAGMRKTGGGIGGALYSRVREEATGLGVIGIFFECLPDDPDLCRDPTVLKQNASRLAFYERFGARPIIGTAYETPVKPGGDNPPYLVFDDLGRSVPLARGKARASCARFWNVGTRSCAPASTMTWSSSRSGTTR